MAGLPGLNQTSTSQTTTQPGVLSGLAGVIGGGLTNLGKATGAIPTPLPSASGAIPSQFSSTANTLNTNPAATFAPKTNSNFFGVTPNNKGIQTTPTGGVNFGNASIAPSSGTALGSDASRIMYTPNGGQFTLNADGSVNKFTPSSNQYSINTGNVSSNDLNSSATSNDIQSGLSSYQQAVQSLMQAEGYSPAYLQAFQQQQNANLNQAALQSNLYTGNNLPGDTENYAQGATAKAEAQNALQSAEAGIGLETQSLARQGNIAGASALVQATQPQGVAPGTALVSPYTGQQAYNGMGGLIGVNQINSVNALSNQYPAAGILPTDSIETAQQKVASSPQYQSQFLAPIALPGGGVSYINKNQIQTNPSTGQAVIVSPTQASNAQGLSSSIQSLQQNISSLQAPLNGVEQNFPLLLNYMQNTGINNLGAPLANQIQQKYESGVTGILAPYNALVTSLQSSISQVISRGGDVTDLSRYESQGVLNPNLSYNDMQNLYSILKTEGQGVISGYQKQLDSANQQLNSIYSTGTPYQAPSSGSTGSYISPDQATW